MYSALQQPRLTDLCNERDDHDQLANQWRLLRSNLAPGTVVTLTMQTGSMAPLIPVGATLEVKSTTGVDCRVGDVVVFRRASQLVAHRLLFGWGHEPGGWFLQRGDSISNAGVIRADAIVGRVVAVITPNAKRHDLTDDDAKYHARREVHRGLRRLVRDILTEPWRKKNP